MHIKKYNSIVGLAYTFVFDGLSNKIDPLCIFVKTLDGFGCSIVLGGGVGGGRKISIP